MDQQSHTIRSSIFGDSDLCLDCESSPIVVVDDETETDAKINKFVSTVRVYSALKLRQLSAPDMTLCIKFLQMRTTAKNQETEACCSASLS